MGLGERSFCSTLSRSGDFMSVLNCKGRSNFDLNTNANGQAPETYVCAQRTARIGKGLLTNLRDASDAPPATYAVQM